MFFKSCLRLGKPLYFCKNLHTLGTTVNKPYFITTPIFYVNAEPHIGHLYSLVVADALKRFHELKSTNRAIFCTGTDEHGIKVQRSASVKAMEPLKFCDEISSKFLSLCKTFNISNTDYIRTTESRHRKAVHAIWRNLFQKGWIYKGKHEGWYCPTEESFVPTSNVGDIVRDGKTIKVVLDSESPVEWCEEENYLFRLSAFRDPLIQWIKSNETFVKPRKYYDLLLNMVESEPRDLSVSRPTSRVKWGISVPDDDSQTVYVWLDALVNYLTVVGYPSNLTAWPPDCHVIGKDILKFHGIYWPAFLMAADLPLPRTLFCHSHWTIDQLKMSKSKGNVVDPFKTGNIYTPEGLRYFLLRVGVPHADGNFSETHLKACLNAELADTFGNLLNRCTAPSINKAQAYPSLTPKDYFTEDMVSILKKLETVREIVSRHFESGNFYLGIPEIMDVLRQTNAVVEHQKPWEMAKADLSKELSSLIFTVFESLRVSAILLQPIIPETCCKVLTKLSINVEERYWKNARPFVLEEDVKLNNEKFIVFQKMR